jgi:hypothetical protein
LVRGLTVMILAQAGLAGSFSRMDPNGSAFENYDDVLSGLLCAHIFVIQSQ